MHVAKTKALISFAVTAKLICVFVFVYAKSRFSHDVAHICLSIPKTHDRYFFLLTFGCLHLDKFSVNLNEPRHEKTCFICLCEKKDADQMHGEGAADQHLRFCYIESKIPLLPKSQISSI